MISASCVLTDYNYISYTAKTTSQYTPAGTSIEIQGWNGALWYKGFMKFDLTTNIPAQCNIVTADLYWYLGTTAALTVVGQRVVRFAEGFPMTWVKSSTLVNWEVQGASGATDVSPNYIFNSTVEKSGAGQAWVHYPIDIKEFAYLRNSNNGIMFKNPDNMPVSVYNTPLDKKPYILVGYTMRVSGTPVYISDYGRL